MDKSSAIFNASSNAAKRKAASKHFLFVALLLAAVSPYAPGQSPPVAGTNHLVRSAKTDKTARVEVPAELLSLAHEIDQARLLRRFEMLLDKFAEGAWRGEIEDLSKSLLSKNKVIGVSCLRHDLESKKIQNLERRYTPTIEFNAKLQLAAKAFETLGANENNRPSVKRQTAVTLELPKESLHGIATIKTGFGGLTPLAGKSNDAFVLRVGKSKDKFLGDTITTATSFPNGDLALQFVTYGLDEKPVTVVICVAEGQGVQRPIRKILPNKTIGWLVYDIFKDGRPKVGTLQLVPEKGLFSRMKGTLPLQNGGSLDVDLQFEEAGSSLSVDGTVANETLHELVQLVEPTGHYVARDLHDPKGIYKAVQVYDRNLGKAVVFFTNGQTLQYRRSTPPAGISGALDHALDSLQFHISEGLMRY